MPTQEVAADLRVDDGGTSRLLNTGDLRDPASAREVTLAASLVRLGEILGELQGTLDVVGTVAVASLPAVTVSNPTANPETGLAKDATIGNRYAGGKTAVCATLNASGSVTVHTPAAGQRIRLFWVYAINDPDAGASPLIQVSLGAAEVYRGYAISHWEIFEGGVDQPLTVSLDQPGSVAFTAHLEEF